MTVSGLNPGIALAIQTRANVSPPRRWPRPGCRVRAGSGWCRRRWRAAPRAVAGRWSGQARHDGLRQTAQRTDQCGAARVADRILLGIGYRVGLRLCLQRREGRGLRGGGSATGAGAVRRNASAIRPTVQCSSQAALSSEALSASRFSRCACARISSDRAPRAWRIMLADWAVHFRATGASDGCSRASRRQSNAWALAATYCAARLASSALAGSRQAIWAMAALSRRVRSSGELLTGGGSAAAEGVDELVVHVPGELEGQVGLGGEMVHRRSIAVSHIHCQ